MYVDKKLQECEQTDCKFAQVELSDDIVVESD